MTVSELTTLSLLSAYRSMFTIRGFEERALALRRADEIAGSIHLCTGQEAIPVGALAALEPGDRVVATYRGHGWAIACGVPLDALAAELCQRATGVNGGRGGSAHLTAPAHGLLGENSIVAAGVPIAAGAALAAQITGSGRVVVVSVGDGATSQGALHEGLVFAAYRRLPARRRVREQRLVGDDADRRDRASRAPRGSRGGLRDARCDDRRQRSACGARGGRRSCGPRACG